MKREKILDLVLCALGAALLSVSGVIAIPAGDVGITLQTFTLFLVLLTMGGKRGSVSCLVYLLLGAVGVPVFSGFRGGFGVLAGPSGGYLFGFLALCLVYWAFTAGHSDKNCRKLGMIFGLLACYLFGSFWYCAVYAKVETSQLALSMGQFVLPYIVPDVIKMVCADAVVRRLNKFL